ncbi:hypothetical protein DFS34DRAFT_491454 [Phlyctochytrium arcticum]|nr:hypothetical protein DFS34DRAFT_491454 [Phlyctochytrium arcticum]
MGVDEDSESLLPDLSVFLDDALQRLTPKEVVLAIRLLRAVVTSSPQARHSFCLKSCEGYITLVLQNLKTIVDEIASYPHGASRLPWVEGDIPTLSDATFEIISSITFGSHDSLNQISQLISQPALLYLLNEHTITVQTQVIQVCAVLLEDTRFRTMFLDESLKQKGRRTILERLCDALLDNSDLVLARDLHRAIVRVLSNLCFWDEKGMDLLLQSQNFRKLMLYLNRHCEQKEEWCVPVRMLIIPQLKSFRN